MQVKVCGLKRPDELAIAKAGGAAFAGLVFFPPSPRALTPAEAGALVERSPDRPSLVGVFVDPDDAWLDAVLDAVPLAMLQLHGRETVGRVAAIKARTGLPVMKALSIAAATDLTAIDVYVQAADWLLLDAKAPKDATLPGGNGLAFDWALLQGLDPALPWMLAGGIDAARLPAARAIGPTAIDVSSGVEAAPGVKDLRLLQIFLAQATAHEPITSASM